MGLRIRRLNTDRSATLISRMKKGERVAAPELAAADSDIVVAGDKIDLPATAARMRGALKRDRSDFRKAAAVTALAGFNATLGLPPPAWPIGAAVSVVAGSVLAAGGSWAAAARDAEDREAFKLYAQLQGRSGFTGAPDGAAFDALITELGAPDER